MPSATWQRVRFSGSGAETLSGVLHLPEGSPRASLILSHCFTCNKDYKVLVWLARAISEAGLAVLRFDYFGLGDSEGRFEGTTISRYIDDLKAAMDWVRQQVPDGPVLLAGHSLGGAVSILATVGTPHVRGVAVMATSADLSNLYRLLPQLAPQNRPHDEPVEVTVGGKSYPLTPAFLQDLQSHSLLESVSMLECPFLVLHGTDDSTTGIEQGERLFAAARQPKAFFALPGAGHLMSRRQDAGLATRILLPWAERIVEGPTVA
ncbi:MAG: alpha/beta fold hydrolase [Acidobacteriota bacterium]